MSSVEEFVVLSGILRGQGEEATCTVHAWKVALGDDSTLARAKIVETSKSLPEGRYQLSMGGKTVEMRYKQGDWVADA